LTPLASLDRPFLAIGDSIDAELFEPISFDDDHWRSSFADGVRTRGLFLLD